jgi:hypothetical protein
MCDWSTPVLAAAAAAAAAAVLQLTLGAGAFPLLCRFPIPPCLTCSTWSGPRAIRSLTVTVSIRTNSCCWGPLHPPHPVLLLLALATLKAGPLPATAAAAAATRAAAAAVEVAALCCCCCCCWLGPAGRRARRPLMGTVAAASGCLRVEGRVVCGGRATTRRLRLFRV